MSSVPFLRVAWACGMATAFLASGEVKATDQSLGSVATPTVLTFSGGALPGAFTDNFLFSIVGAAPLEFTAFLSTGYNNRFFILDMDASLLRDGVTVAEGDAVTKTLPEGFPSRDVSFQSIVLSPGSYALQVTGTATNAVDSSSFSTYEGTMTFAAVAPTVAEPATWLLFGAGAGAGAIGLGRRRWAVRFKQTSR